MTSAIDMLAALPTAADGASRRYSDERLRLDERTASAQPLPRARRRGALGRRDRGAAARARARGRGARARRARRWRASRAAARRRRDAGAAGSAPARSREAVRRTGAEVVHAHNINPLFGAARAARRRGGPARASSCTSTTTASFCAIAIGYRDGEVCTRCRGRNTLPGRAAALPRQPARGGRLRRRPGAAAAAARWRRSTGSSSPSALRGRPARGARAAAATASRCCRNFLPREPSSRPRRRTAGRARAVRRAGWSRRRASTPRSRPPRAPACRSRSPAPGPRPSRLRALAPELGAPVALPRAGSAPAELRGVRRARGLRRGAVALGRAVPVLGDRGDGGRRAGARVAASAACPRWSARSTCSRPATPARWARAMRALWDDAGAAPRRAARGASRARATLFGAERFYSGLMDVYAARGAGAGEPQVPDARPARACRSRSPTTSGAMDAMDGMIARRERGYVCAVAGPRR